MACDKKYPRMPHEEGKDDESQKWFEYAEMYEE
jgi:hypothetical protein